MQDLLIISAFFLLFYLLGKFKVIETSAFGSMISLIKEGFVNDYTVIKKEGFQGMKKRRWHLHSLIGIGTSATALISIFDIQSFDKYWQQFVLIVFGSFFIQAFRELALGLFKGIKSDFSDARFGGYASAVFMILFGVFSAIFPKTLSDLHFVIISLICYLYTAYLVYIKKN
jgi:hypothetical protein